MTNIYVQASFYGVCASLKGPVCKSTMLTALLN